MPTPIPCSWEAPHSSGSFFLLLFLLALILPPPPPPPPLPRMSLSQPSSSRLGGEGQPCEEPSAGASSDSGEPRLSRRSYTSSLCLRFFFFLFCCLPLLAPSLPFSSLEAGSWD